MRVWSYPDVVIYSKFHRNPFRGFGAPGGRNLPIPITLAIGFYNSLHYRASRVVQAVIFKLPPYAVHTVIYTLSSEVLHFQRPLSLLEPKYRRYAVLARIGPPSQKARHDSRGDFHQN